MTSSLYHFRFNYVYYINKSSITAKIEKTIYLTYSLVITHNPRRKQMTIKKNQHSKPRKKKYVKIIEHTLCKDVIQIICDFADLKTQLNLCELSKECDNYLKIKELHACEVTQKIIEQKKFSKLQKLNAYDNPDIKSVNHLAETLLELSCNRGCGINQKGISQLKKLQVLHASNNSRITSVNHLANTLIYLSCKGGCGINQKGISQLKKL